MRDKRISVLAIRPVHPNRGEPSYIELAVVLDYLKGAPVASVRLTPAQAIRLIEQAAMAVRVVTQ
jgi:hypothetical protein